MIYDLFENVQFYFNDNDKLFKGLQFALSFDKSNPDGRYELDGERIYATVATYLTKDISEVKFEAHRKYIDIQLLLEGKELCDITHEKALAVETSYSSEKDVEFYKDCGNFSSIVLEPGRFAIFYPHDIHRPCRKVNGFETVRKMVVKVAAEI